MKGNDEGQRPKSEVSAEAKDRALLKAVWDVLKQNDYTYDAAVRVAVMLIMSCARGSDAVEDTFEYADRLLKRGRRALTGGGCQ